jgi:putative FmdB family regulatory protein
MARFEFFCPKCDITFEVDQKICEVNTPICPQCNDNQAKKCISSPSFTISGYSAKNSYGLKK